MSSKSCHPRSKFVFIKTHKTGSCTAVNIFQRYAISHHLSVLMPTGGNLLSWPFPPAEEDYVHTPDEQYDVLLSHMVYNKTWLRTKFPANTAYISILREPSSHLRSAMNYYSLPELLKIESKNPVQTFLQDPWKYKDLSEAYFDFCNVTWDGTRNFLSFDLGYPTEGAEDKERARRYISELEADFTLVLLLEHLDESLVLLRRLMCWEVRDVLYDIEAKNNRTYPYKSYIPTAEELANLRRWKAVDYLLYDTFNASLWRRIAAQGPDFYEELHYFREVRKRVSKFCHTRKRRRSRHHQQPLIIKASKWSPQFAVNSMYCRGIQYTEIELGKYIRKRASAKDKEERKVMRVAENVLRIVHGLPTVKFQHDGRSKNGKMIVPRKANL
ncbi:galactosylceramide sulfotransferase-like [Branchiostoma floridae x Branchiostoma japonicum]